MSFALQKYYRNNHIENALYGTAWRIKDRKTIISQMILESGKIYDNKSEVLDVGCRDGNLTAELGLPCRITGIDVDSDALLKYKLARQNATVETMDCNEHLNFCDESFDLIIAGEIIEHLISPQSFISEIYRILKRGGIFIGSTPNTFRWDKRIRLFFGNDPKTFSDATHTQYFSHRSLDDILRRNFAKVKIINHPRNHFNKFNNFFSSGFIWKVQK